MALVKRSDVKTLLGIASATTTYDDLIELMIEFMGEWLPTYLNNKFTNTNLYISVNTISFVANAISDSDSGIVTAGFAQDMDIYIQGSKHNNGFYVLSSVAAGVMKVKDHTFVTETAEFTPVIYQVQYPKGLNIVTANLIKHQMTQGQNTGVASESIGDYSVSYDMSGIPMSLLQQLSPYKKVGF